MNMKLYSILKCIVVAVLILGLQACTDSQFEEPSTAKIVGETFVVSGSLSIPNMPELVARSRGLGSRDLSMGDSRNMHLTIFEFDLGKTPEYSFLTNIYYATLTDPENAEADGEIKFSVTLKASAKPKVLHLMLADKELYVEGGSIASVLPLLAVEGFEESDNGGIMMFNRRASDMTNGDPIRNFKPAYWGEVKFENGYVKTTGNDEEYELLETVEEKMTQIPLIRNIAKISVEIAQSVTNFNLLGFEVVNAPTAGTVAPWDRQDLDVPELLTSDKSMKAYPNLTYTGILAGEAEFFNTEEDALSVWDEKSKDHYNFMTNTDAVEIYEHPYEESMRSYVIVHGEFTRKLEGGGTETKPWYYKLDIGSVEEMTTADGEKYQKFNCYNIIRNIHYRIIITSVETEGAATINEAISQAPFNNISFSTETSGMLNISNGRNLLFVNDTDHVIVNDSTPVEILFRYVQDITGIQSEKNEIPYVIIEQGPVIKSWTEKKVVKIKNTAGEWENWMSIFITPQKPTTIVKTQSFIIVDPEGLGRTINLLLRSPWRYAPIVDSDDNPVINPATGEKLYVTVAPGDADMYDTQDPTPKPVSCEAGQDLTIYFNLPDGLPESMFPLNFQIESRNQWIENNKEGTLVVTTGPSLFDKNKIAISYIKKVSYTEYIYGYDTENENNNPTHTIRCRFTTIASVEPGTTAEIKIQNEYFKPDINVKFTRDNI